MLPDLPLRAVRAAANVRKATEAAASLRQATGSLRQATVAATASWRDPAAKLRRRRRRARRGTAIRTLGTATFAILAAWAYGHGDPFAATFVTVIAVAVLIATAQSARVYWRLQRTPMPQPAPPPPPAGSVAREPMATLAARERTLGELLVLLGPAAGDTAAEARAAADVLRERAGRIVTLESARADAPRDAKPELAGAIGLAHTQLTDGVAAYERLVSAAASAVAAAGGDPNTALTDHRLRDATDALSGLAAGLREIDSRR